MRVTASAPGKTILIGEHAAVYGRPALVAAVDRRLRAELCEVDGTGVRLRLPAVGVTETVSWSHLREYARTARRLWQDYEKQPDPAAFKRLRG
ncbi:MAG: mevalonate kinase, partial [Acidobacteriota bacterium]